MEHHMERELQIHNVKITNVKSISTIGVMNTILGQILNPVCKEMDKVMEVTLVKGLISSDILFQEPSPLVQILTFNCANS